MYANIRMHERIIDRKSPHNETLPFMLILADNHDDDVNNSSETELLGMTFGRLLPRDADYQMNCGV